MYASHAHHRRAHALAQPPTQVVADPPVDLAVVHALAERASTMTASIYLPTDRFAWDPKDGPLRLTHLIDTAHQKICDAMSRHKADTLLAPLRALAADPDFWAHPQDAVALFCDHQGVRTLWLPTTMPEQVVVSSACHIKPLIPLLHGDGYFYMVELTTAGVRLLRGTRSGLHVMLAGHGKPGDDVPECGSGGHLDDALCMLHAAGHLVAHVMADGGDAKPVAPILQLFRRIDGCLDQVLHAQHSPVLLSGTDHLIRLYRSVSSYPHVQSRQVTVDPVRDSQRAIHDQAWEIVAPHFQAAETRARHRWATLSGTDRMTNDLAKVLHALILGRVGDLVVACDRDRWGTYDIVHDVVREHVPPWSTDDDLLNLAVIRAMKSRVMVQAVPHAEMPDGGDIMAVFRA